MDRRPRPIATAEWAPPPESVQFFRFVLWRIPFGIVLWLIVILATSPHISRLFIGFTALAALASLIALGCALKFTEWFTAYLRLRLKNRKTSFLAEAVLMQGDAKTGVDYGVLTLEGSSLEFDGLQTCFSLRNDRLKFLDKCDGHNVSEHYCVKLDAPNLLIGFRTPGFFTITFKSDRAIKLSERMRAWKNTHSSARPQRLPPLKLMPEARITVPEICGYTLLGLVSVYYHVANLFHPDFHSMKFWSNGIPSLMGCFEGLKGCRSTIKTRKAQLAFEPPKWSEISNQMAGETEHLALHGASRDYANAVIFKRPSLKY